MQAQTDSKDQNILLAYDGSEHSQTAIKLLCDLKFSPASHVTVLTVFTHRQISDHEKFRAQLDFCRECLEPHFSRIDTELLLGYPAQKIAEFADQISPDLIVIGARGLRATLGILLGGVAQQVIEYGAWPVLVVRAPYQPIKSVLFATDGSECSTAALDYLLRFPLPENCDVRAIHIIPPLDLPIDTLAHTWPIGPEMIANTQHKYQAELEAWHSEEEISGRNLLTQTKSKLETAGISTQTILRQGDAVTEILEYIQQNPVDLIVTGSRGLSAVPGWLLGSVSRKLVHYSGCSVLVIKAPVCRM